MRLSKKTRLGMSAALLLCAAGLGVAEWDTTNLMTVNPGFESGSTGWFTAGGVVDSTVASQGTRSGKLDSTGSQPRDWRSRDYSAQAGTKYMLAFDYRTSPGATGAPQMRFRFFNSSYVFKGEAQQTLPLTNGQWQRYELTLVCPADADRFDAFFTTNTFGSFTGIAWLDNAGIYTWIEPPAPAFTPADGSRGWADALVLQWESNPQADAYRVYLGDDPDAVNQDEATFLPGDLDLDSRVSLDDVAMLAAQWLTIAPPAPTADLDGDDQVNNADFNILAGYYSQSTDRPATYLATTGETKLPVQLPAMNQDYYWRVDATVDGQVHKGDVRQFQCEDYLDYGIAPPTHIYYIEQSALNRTQQVLFQSLQGLTARVRPTLFIRNASNSPWLSDLYGRYGIGLTSIASVSGPAGPLAWALSHFTGCYDGYVLCDAYNDPASLTAAVSLAAALPNALVVDVTDEHLMTSRGKPRLFDMRGLDEKWVWDHYKDNLTRKAIFVQRDDINSHGAYLRDLPVAIRALTWWHPSLSDTQAVFEEFLPNIPCYGWDSAVKSGEGEAVKFHSQYSMYTAVTDWMLNLSLYAGMASRQPAIPFSQPCGDNVYTPEDNVHYVTFCISDMDNANTLFDTPGWARNTDRYASPHRGQFAMGWGMPPIMMKIGPSVMKWWYDRATEKDCFIAYCSGLDYTNPSHFPAFDIQAGHLAKYLEAADLSTLCIIDHVIPERQLTHETYYETAKHYTAIDQLRGLFYLEYVRYAPHGGRIFWFDGKPMVTARFDFRDDAFYSAVRTTPEDLAASINALPTDPTSENGYTFVTIHAWSRGWNGIAECVELLDDDVRVVTPNELIEQLYLHNVGGN